MKESKVASPAWMGRARLAWKSVRTPPPSRKWTAYWINKFVVYLESRNEGALPDRVPSRGAISSFCRFIGDSWECEDWKIEQARESLDWFAVAAGFGPSRSGVNREAASGDSNRDNGGDVSVETEYGEWQGEAERVDLGGTLERTPGVSAGVPDLPKPWLLDNRLTGRFSKWRELVIAECRRQGHSIRTEKTYDQWCRRFSDWWLEVSRDDVAAPEVGGLATVVESAVVGFMDYLAVDKCSAAATQRQALNAVSFLVTKTLGLEALDFSNFVRGKRRKNLPVVLSVDEVQRLLAQMKGETRMAAELLYGGGLRLMECVRLRIKDFDFEYGTIAIRAGIRLRALQ